MRRDLHSHARPSIVKRFPRGLQRGLSAFRRTPATPRVEPLQVKRIVNLINVTSCSRSTASGTAGPKHEERVLLFDVMDTIVWDPFYSEMPRYFSITLKELFARKHPTAWVEFESAEISEAELFSKFFHDGYQFDGEGLRQTMVDGYRFLDGMEPLLEELSALGQAMHVVSNYPIWYEHIEAKLRLSQYLPWTFMSCTGPMQGLRKPSPDCFKIVAETLGKRPDQLLLIDDRKVNVDAAAAQGWDCILSSDAAALRVELQERGILP